MSILNVLRIFSMRMYHHLQGNLNLRIFNSIALITNKVDEREDNESVVVVILSDLLPTLLSKFNDVFIMC